MKTLRDVVVFIVVVDFIIRNCYFVIILSTSSKSFPIPANIQSINRAISPSMAINSKKPVKIRIGKLSMNTLICGTAFATIAIAAFVTKTTATIGRLN